MIDKSLIQQGIGILKSLLFCVCLCAMPQRVMAQTDMPTSDNEETKYKAEDFGFNAIDLRQGRFLYGDSREYENSTFYDHLSVGAIWHYDKIHERIPQGYAAALNYGVFVEKELNKVHSLRLLFYEGTYQQTLRSIRLNKYQLELLHSFNWTRFFGGYNPYRKIEAVTNIGLGGFYSERVGQVEIGPMFIMGGGARMLLSPLFSLGVEPYVALAGDGVDHSGRSNYRKYDVLYGTDVSLSYTLHNELSKEEREEYRGDVFIDFGLGVQFQPSLGYLPPSALTLPFFATAGPQLKLGVGYRLSPGLAIRTAGNFSSSNWRTHHLEPDNSTLHPAYDIRLKSALLNGRLDLLFSPYRFFTGREDNRFDINAIIGWEYGRMIKVSYNAEDLLRTNYDGFSSGLQFRYNYDKHTALYIEPRLSFANYSIPYAAPYQDYVDRYRDQLFSMAAGLEFVANEHRFLGKMKQPSKFSPYVALALQGGANYMFTSKEHAGDFYIDYSAGIAGDMQVTPYSGVRVMADYSQISNRGIYSYKQNLLIGDNSQVADTALCTSQYGFVNISADYVFDLGTLLQGYSRDHRWDVALAFGPVYSQRVKEKAIISKNEMLWEFRGNEPVATVPVVDHSRSTEHALGVQVGIPASYRVNSRLDVLFEPRLRFFPSDYIDQTRSLGGTKILNAQVGLRYSLNDRYYLLGTDSLGMGLGLKPGHLFTSLAVGAQTSQMLADMGPRIEAGIGYWLNPGVAARASFNFTSHDWRRFPTALNAPDTEVRRVESSLRQTGTSGRIDLLLNPYAYILNRYDSPFAFNFVGGWEYGILHRGNLTETLVDKYHALSAGFQLRYNQDSFRAIFLEPRYTYNLKNQNGWYSLVAGLEFGATEHAFHRGKNQPGGFEPTFSLAMLGGLGYLYDGMEYTEAPISDYTAGIAAEYKFTPYSGVRLTTNYTNYRQRELYTYRHDEHYVTENLYNYGVGYVNVGVDYLLDMTTLLQGYTQDRWWNVALAIGPTYGGKVGKSEPAIQAGYIPSTGVTSYSESAGKHLWGMQMGIPVAYRVDNNWAVMFEPRVKTVLKHPFNKRSSYPFVQYDALIGVKYTPGEKFYNRLNELKQNNGYRHDFVNFAIGTQYAMATGLPFGGTGGLQLGLGVGRWMNALWGVRFGAELGTSHLRSVLLTNGDNTHELMLKSARIGGRVDLMMNPLAMNRTYTPESWATALLLGWELGGKIDAKYTHVDTRFYNSLSVGAQVRCHTDELHTLYLEPRYMVNDHLVSLTAGMEFAMTEHRFHSSKNQSEEFVPYYNVGFSGGINHLLLPTIYLNADQLDFGLGLSGEYHFTPYSGSRLTFGYSHLVHGALRGNELVNYGIGHLNVGVDYMFDLSTLFAGYTPGRRWDVALAAGPVFSARVAADKEYAKPLDKFAMGVQMAFPVQYRVTEHFGLSLEPRARVFGPDYATPRYTIGGFMSKIINIQVGVKYTF